MDKETKLLIGKVLGEIYRTQRTLGASHKKDSRIFGLLNGFERDIDDELNMDSVSEWELEIVEDYLHEYDVGKKNLENINFLEMKLDVERQGGIKEGKLIDILKYLKSDNRFTPVIDRLGNYELRDYDL